MNAVKGQCKNEKDRLMFCYRLPEVERPRGGCDRRIFGVTCSSSRTSNSKVIPN